MSRGRVDTIDEWRGRGGWVIDALAAPRVGRLSPGSWNGPTLDEGAAQVLAATADLSSELLAEAEQLFEAGSAPLALLQQHQMWQQQQVDALLVQQAEMHEQLEQLAAQAAAPFDLETLGAALGSG